MVAAGRKSPFAIRVLGTFEVRHGDLGILDGAWPRRKAQALLKLLAVSERHSLHREELLEQLWPELEPSAAANNLHKNLHYVRSALAEQGIEDQLVGLRGQTVELVPDTGIDAAQFREAAQAALSSPSMEAFRDAAALYAGDLLPDDLYEEWTIAERDELRQLYTEVLSGLARLHEERQEHPAAIEALQRLLHADPLNEEAHRQLMRLYAASGSRHRALRKFEQLRDLLAREFNVAPSTETIRLVEQIQAGASAPAADSETGDPGTDEGATAAPPPALATFGRDDALERANASLSAASDGRAKTVFVRGEAGIGKTHLVEQALATARASGFRVLVSHCAELESSVAYQPFRDALLRATAIPGVEDFARRSLYLRLLLFGAGESEYQARDSNIFQAELFGEVHRLVQMLTAQQPLAIFLDDLHLADEDSVRLLHYLARRKDERLVLFGTYRPEDLERNPPILELITSLRKAGVVKELDLQPLPRESMAALVRELFAPHPVAERLLDEVIDRSDGNPLFAGEIMRTFIREGWALLVDGRWERQRSGMVPIPTAIQDILEIRLRKLSPAAQEEIHLAAVSGREFDFPTLQQVLDLPEGEALDALDECLEADIIKETPDRYSFRHDLLREAIYGRLSRARRQVLHRRLGQTLEERRAEALACADVEAIARHYDLSDEPWRAVPSLVESGRRAAGVFANEKASGFYERAQTLLVEHPGALDRHGQAVFAGALGDLEQRRGNTERAVELFLQSHALHNEAGNPEAAASARGKAALGYIVLGDFEKARELISAMLVGMWEEAPSNVVARAHYLLAQLHWHSGENRDALEAAERSLEAASASGNAAERAQACEVLALACHSMGDWQRGVHLELERHALGVPGFNTDEAFDAHL